MRAGERVNKLRGDPHPLAGFAHGPFKHIPHPKLPPDLPYVDSLSLVRKTRIAGDHEKPADAAERGDDLLDHAVGEVLLIRIAAHICERQYRNRRLVGEREGGYGPSHWLCHLNSVHPDRLGDVFDLLIAEIIESQRQLVAYVIAR